MTKSYISFIHAPQRVESPLGPIITVTNTPQCQKLGKPISAKDKNLWKIKSNKEIQSLLKLHEELHLEEENPSKSARVLHNHNTGNAERPNPNVLGNDEDLVNKI